LLERKCEYVNVPSAQPLVVLGNVETLHLRVDIDGEDIPRFQAGSPARCIPRGDTNHEFLLTFVYVEPYVLPKRSLTGNPDERVDTRSLQVIYAIETSDTPVYVGQQMDVFIDAAAQSRNPLDQ
jgi:hypothetical protein